jgi:hypothetical protein
MAGVGVAAAAELEMVAVTEVEPAANMDLVNVSGVGPPAVLQSMDFAETEVSFSEAVFASREVAAEPATVADSELAASVVLYAIFPGFGAALGPAVPQNVGPVQACVVSVGVCVADCMAIVVDVGFEL